METKKMCLENMVKNFFKNKFNNKKILIFGNSGFVGSWLSLSLSLLGANILGVSLKMKNKNCLSNTYDYKKNITSINCDLKNLDNIESKIINFKPEIVIHLASQPIVKIGYINPKKTYETNIGGAVKIFELLRKIQTVKKILVFTSDKVYSNSDGKTLTENSRIGGLDPYSASKSAQDIIAQSYGFSFFQKSKMIILRSGNIIGGGDWAENRIIPDIVRSYLNKNVLKLRSVNSTRPWIHIFDVINAILIILTKKIKSDKSLIFNLSPKIKKQISVNNIINLILINTPIQKLKIIRIKNKIKEKKYLHISSNKAQNELSWKTKLDLKNALKLTIKFYLLDKKKLYNEAVNQINNYFSIK
jgi:CDP-glucose 4,6-dehydratase|tara:strand:- start:2048 stop:3124 length:1077 start_codon:yes stop_codon:yes gene_type:complete